MSATCLAVRVSPLLCATPALCRGCRDFCSATDSEPVGLWLLRWTRSLTSTLSRTAASSVAARLRWRARLATLAASMEQSVLTRATRPAAAAIPCVPVPWTTRCMMRAWMREGKLLRFAVRQRRARPDRLRPSARVRPGGLAPRPRMMQSLSPSTSSSYTPTGAQTIRVLDAFYTK